MTVYIIGFESVKGSNATVTTVSVGKTEKGDENDGGCGQIEASVVMVKLDHFRDSTLFWCLLFFTQENI